MVKVHLHVLLLNCTTRRKSLHSHKVHSLSSGISAYIGWFYICQGTELASLCDLGDLINSCMGCRQIETRTFRLLLFVVELDFRFQQHSRANKKVIIKEPVSQICSVLREAFEENAEMLSLRKFTWKILKWRILLLLCSGACTLYYIQLVSNTAHDLFIYFCGSTFPLLHMNRFDGIFTSFIQPILVFFRISRWGMFPVV